MSVLRNVLIGLGLVLGVPLLLALGAAAYVQAELPVAQAARVRGPHGLVGVQTGGSYAWIVPSATGVVLVDAGFDRSGKALLREIGQRAVRGVVLTHGHTDQLGALAVLPPDPARPVYLDAADVPFAAGEALPTAWMARALTQVLPPPAGVTYTPIPDGDLEIDGVRLRAVHVPGHTAGSVAWLWEGVLFTGDAVLGGSPLLLPPDALNELPREVTPSVSKLLPLDFDAVADGRVGLTGAARPAVFRLAGAKPSAPTVSVRTEGGAAVTERQGVYVATPVPDARGERPELVVFPDGTSWRIGDGGDPAANGRTIAVRGRQIPGPGPGIRIEVVERRFVDAPPAPAALAGRVGQWVTVQGTLGGFRPLAAGAAWGEATLALDGGVTVPVAVPVGGATEGPVTLTAKVQPDGAGGIRLASAPIAEPVVGGASP